MRKKILLFLMICLFWNSCWYDPWRSERYVNLETDKVAFHDGFPDKNNFKNYYIGDCFVLVELTRDNPGSDRGQGPYTATIEGWTLNADAAYMLINNVNIISSIDKKHALFEKEMLPLKIPFKKKRKTYYYPTGKISCARLVADNKLYLEFYKDEIVTIVLNIKIVTKDSLAYEGEVKIKFVPVLTKGNFRQLTA